MEQRGSGFARMHDAMLNHGLDAPVYTEQDGFFVVTFPGPNGQYDRLKPPAGVVGLITPAIEAKLNNRQKKIMVEAQNTGFVTSGWCQKHLKVVRDTANRDFASLVELGLLTATGKGRGARYVLTSGVE
jgi:predicted HTH transcriptional regulator